MTTPLGAGAEFDRIRAIIAALGERATGLGDDCALIPLGDEFIALSTDLSIAGVHFRSEWLAIEEIGWRAAAAALSDLAAVGAEPIGVLASLALPPESSASDAVTLMEGVASVAESVGGRVLGGDLAQGPALTIDVTVIGRTTNPVRRSGARPGDGLWVTGWLGGSRAALQAFLSGTRPEPDLREAFAHPLPRVMAGRWLAEHGATALIDLSDGLAGDAGHLSAASAVELAVELENLPITESVSRAATRLGESAHRFAAIGGEDYELLVTLPAGFREADARAFQRDVGIPLTRIGQVGAGTGVRLTLAGAPVSLTGYSHFA